MSARHIVGKRFHTCTSFCTSQCGVGSFMPVRHIMGVVQTRSYLRGKFVRIPTEHLLERGHTRTYTCTSIVDFRGGKLSGKTNLEVIQGYTLSGGVSRRLTRT